MKSQEDLSEVSSLDDRAEQTLAQSEGEGEA